VRHDWELRCAFFNNIVGVSAFVGMDSLEHYILPCILQALTGKFFIIQNEIVIYFLDEEEFVIDKAVNSLASLCELGLFRKHKLFDIADKTAPMLYYPNMWIRYGIIH
jgi:phosphoinositide-3-kinase regulatory subunit 4